MKRRVSILLFFIVFFLGGCATSRSLLDVNVPATTDSSPLNGKEVYINSITDKRVFEVNPRTPSIPSLDPTEEANPEITVRAVGRKRNTYGKALGDLLLKEGVTVESLIALSVRRAFIESGYKVLDDKNQVNKDTYVVDGIIDKFWAWFTPGFWQITLATEIATTLTITPPENNDPIKVSVVHQYPATAAFESTYITCIENALRAYVNKLKPLLQ